MFKKLFSKNTQDSLIDPVIPPENFSLFKLALENGTGLATINTGYDNYPNKKFFPWYVAILMEIGEKNQNGHPTNSEAEILNDLEEKITQFLGLTQTVHKIGRVTRNGERDIMYYIDDPKLDQEQVKGFFDSISSVRPINVEIEKDEAWKNVSTFIK